MTTPRYRSTLPQNEYLFLASPFHPQQEKLSEPLVFHYPDFHSHTKQSQPWLSSRLLKILPIFSYNSIVRFLNCLFIILYFPKTFSILLSFCCQNAFS